MDALANYFIRKYPDNFVAGTEDCNIILIKYRYNYKNPLQNILMVIAIGINYNPVHLNVFDTHDYIKSRLAIDIRFQKLLKWSEYFYWSFSLLFHALYCITLQYDYQLCFLWGGFFVGQTTLSLPSETLREWFDL